MRKPHFTRCASRAAIAAALALVPAAGRTQGFVGTPSVVSGNPVFSGSGTTGTVTLPGSIPQTIINWTPTGTVAGNVVNFLPAGQTENFTVGGAQTVGAVYSVLNRVIPASGTPQAGFYGAVTSDANVRVWFYSPGGLLIGPTATFNVGGLVLSAADPATTTSPASGLTTFVNTVNGTESFSLAAASGSTAAITIQQGAKINVAASAGATYMVAIAPQISNAGTINVSGSTALIAAESASFSVDPSGLFGITVNSGTTVGANTFVNSGSVGSSDSVADNAASVRRVYMVAVPKNTAITMAIASGGDIGFAAAGAAAMEGNAIILSEGKNIADSTTGPVATTSAAGVGTSSLTIGGGTYSSNLYAFGTGSISVTDPAKSIGFLANAALAAPQTGVSAAISTISVAGNLTLSADNTQMGINNANLAQVSVAPGATLAVGTNAAALGVNGDLTVTANDFAYGNAGSAAVDVTGGTLTVAGNLNVGADSGWSLAATQSNPGGIITNGGSAALAISAGGSATIGGSATLGASADGTAASNAYMSGALVPDTAINAFGGKVSVGTTGANSLLNVGGSVLSAKADAIGANDTTFANGGTATGGTVTYAIDASSTVKLGATTALVGSASATSGDGNTGSGGTALGGTVELGLNGGLLTMPGAPSVSLSAGAVGGASAIDHTGVTGGAATGGTARIDFGSNGAILTDTLALTTQGSGFLLDASAHGGGSTIAAGGAATGGTVAVAMTSGSQNFALEGNVPQFGLTALAVGGSGGGAGGGAATGGTARITLAGGTIVAPTALVLDTAASGGSDAIQAGGAATGGLDQITINGNGYLITGGASFVASASGGTGATVGGNALGGNVLIALQTGGALTPTNATFDTSHAAGTSAGAAGQSASAGGARITSDAAYAAPATVGLVGNSSLEIDAAGAISVPGAIVGTGAGAYLKLVADTGGSGVGTVTLANGAINLSGNGATTDIYYNPAALGTPTDFSGGVAAGTWTGYQLVNSAAQLQQVGAFPSQNFALSANIDATQTQGWNAGAGFVPIGTAATPFSGNFDGLNHTITGLFINLPAATDPVGLFGTVSAVNGTAITIRNLGLVDPVITGNVHVGGLIGEIKGVGCAAICGPVSLVNDFTTGTFGTVTGFSGVGGILGFSSQASGITIAGSHADVAVTANGSVAGGLVGELDAGTIVNAFATGTVNAVGIGTNGIGGLVGITSASLAEVYATGQVMTGANATDVGGLLGALGAKGTVTLAYSAAPVEAGAGSTNIGGLVGINTASGLAISQSWAAGPFNIGTGSSNVGGLVGNNASSTGQITSSYWDSFSTGQAIGVGGGFTGSTNVFAVNAVTSDPTQTAAANYALASRAYGNLTAGSWIYDGNGTRPIGAWEVPVAQYLVAPVNSAHQVQLIDQNIAGQYLVTQSIDMGGTARTGDVWGGLGFIPIALGAPFSGTLSGSGHVLSNLSYNVLNYEQVGLFANNSGLIADLGIWNATLNSPTGTAAQAGLLVAQNSGTITDSFATGTLIAPFATVGGLVGVNSGYIGIAYASVAIIPGPNATLAAIAGGLVGQNTGAITQTYANGPVSGTTTGGLVGQTGSGAIGSSYWDVALSGQSLGCSAGGCPLVVGLTTAQTLQSANFSGFTIDTTGAGAGQTATSWRQYEGSTAPLLNAFLQPIMVQPDSLTMTYNAGTPNIGVTTYGANAALTLGTPLTAGASRNAGTYLITYSGGLYSSQIGYSFYAASTPGTLQIYPALLSLAAASDSRTYDTTTTSTAPVGVTGLQGNDTISNLTQSFDSANAGARTLGVNAGYVINDGNNGANYIVSTASASGTITPAPLSIAAVSDIRTYNATTTSAVTPQATGLLGNDSVSNLTQAFDSANAGQRTLSVNPGYVINDGNNGGNYTVTGVTTASGSINPAPLTLAAVTDSRGYNATKASTATPTVTGLFGNDSVTNLGEAFDSANAGSRTLSVNGNYVINDGNNGGNYIVTSVSSAPGTITRAALTIAAVTDTRSYDATINAAAVPTVTGLQGNDTVTTLYEQFSSANAGARTLSVGAGFTINDGNNGGNYTVTTTTAAGTITPAPLTITAASDSRTYNATTASSGTPVATGLFGSDTVGNLAQAFDSANAGQRTLGVLPGYTIIDNNGGANYTVTTVTTPGTITPAPLTITAASDSRTYNATTASAGVPKASGLFGSDSVTGLSQAFDSANAGSRTLAVNTGYVVNDGNGGGNYTVTTTTASGTISPAPLGVSYVAAPATSVYGNALGTLTGTVQVQGLQGSDTAAQVLGGTPAFTTAATGASPVGSYAVTGSGLAATNGNYAISFTQAPGNATDLSITARPISVTALDQSRAADAANPPLGYTISGPGGAPGLVNGDQLTGALTTLATPASPPGSYAITQGTLAASPNYALSFTPGTLIVTQGTGYTTTITTTITAIDTGLPGGGGGGGGGGSSGSGGGSGGNRNGNGSASSDTASGADTSSTPQLPSIHASAVAATRGAVLPSWSPGPMLDPPPLKTPPPVTEPVSINGLGGANGGVQP